jgi:hypothetical protein
MAQHYSNPSRATDAHALPDVETFYHAGVPVSQSMYDEEGNLYPAGWYYWFCFPGCMPDGEPVGPFETEEAAVADFTDDLPWNEFSK